MAVSSNALCEAGVTSRNKVSEAMIKGTVIVHDSKNFELSDDARRFAYGDPAEFPMVDGIYSIRSRLECEPTRWFVAYVAPNSQGHGSLDKDGEERKGRVEKYLERTGVQFYWPKSRRPKKIPLARRRGKKVYKTIETVSPLLPRYVLVRMPVKDTPFGLLSTDEAQMNGIGGFVVGTGYEEGPAFVRDGEVEEIMRRERTGEFNRMSKRGQKGVVPDWAKIGTDVRVADGPFASFQAVIEEMTTEGRLKVAVNIFGRSTPVELEFGQIERI